MLVYIIYQSKPIIQQHCSGGMRVVHVIVIRLILSFHSHDYLLFGLRLVFG